MLTFLRADSISETYDLDNPVRRATSNCVRLWYTRTNFSALFSNGFIDTLTVPAKGDGFPGLEIERLGAVEDISDGPPNFEGEPESDQECASIPENTRHQVRNSPLLASSTALLLGVRLFKRFHLHHILPSSPQAVLPNGVRQLERQREQLADS